MSDTKPNPFILPDFAGQEIPDEDLHTLARLAGEEVRRKNALLRAKGLFPLSSPIAKPLVAEAKPEAEDSLSR